MDLSELSTAQIVGAVSMTIGCLLWVIAYFQIMRKAWLDKAYGFPWAYTCAAVSYEFIHGWVLEPSGHGVIAPLQIATMQVWFLVDLGLLAQLLIYGPKLLAPGWRRRLFHPLTLAAIAGVFALELYLLGVLDDASGHLLGYGMGAIGAWTFVGLALGRPDSRGLSWGAAWAKGIGTLLITVPHIFAYPVIAPGRSYVGIWICYVLFSAGDAVYIAILWRRRRQATCSAGSGSSPSCSRAS